ncbi:hypothetical protein [Methylobacterium aerolatum]|uniref:Uncharacterized protein n=1 Tax=Methylobacterium aerolatum TaxID=418708 RepID=A0ABU0HZ47_9HYPH|nr:hypothetical protein [Methylobacterium aerolatum]MDQ0447616.1 hypothetical protein [Methylobacterium aerolatum]GJD34716.1 hypothetical protein FMGBMHLM_1619 [Methylobacterium aerolatum]
MSRPTSDSGTVTRKPDDAVGSRGNAAAAGGHQSPQQAAITDMDGGGKDDAARNRDWGTGEPGASPPALGGSSGGHSDQKASRGPEADRTVADSLSRAERENDR